MYNSEKKQKSKTNRARNSFIRFNYLHGSDFTDLKMLNNQQYTEEHLNDLELDLKMIDPFEINSLCDWPE